MPEFLKVTDLKLHYRTGGQVVRAVDGVSFEIEKPGQALALIGESGCGKTSVALAMLRLLPNNVSHFSGQMRLDGRELLSLDEADFRLQYRWKKIAWVPQNTRGSFDPYYKIESQFAEVFKTHGVTASKEDILQLMAQVGISPEKSTTIPDRLSGGEIQRAGIALAIALKPELIILDEPTSALDPSLKGQVISLLADLKKQYGASYVFITHDINQAAAICEQFAVLYAGRIVEKGSRAAVLGSPLHPYTQKLLQCVTIAGGAGVKYIPGQPPDLRQAFPGCPFAPRCPNADRSCAESAPLLESKGGGHFAACHRL